MCWWLCAMCASWQSPFARYSMADFQHARARFELQGLVQLHHIVPRQFRRHPVLDGYDTESGYNFMLLPTLAGKELLNTTRPIHEGGHRAYNRYVGSRLEEMWRTGDSRVPELAAELRRRLRASQQDIPWA